MSATAIQADPKAPVVEMAGVTVSRLHNPGTTVLEDVNWSAANGDYWLVAGRHHSGKSDFMMTAAGLMPPHAGRCRILGVELNASEKFTEARRRLGFVFDGGQLLNRLTIGENIALPLAYHRNCPLSAVADEVAALLELTELTPWRDYLPSGLGRNWLQRAGLARALALKPKAFFLDSPLSGLDPVDTAWWLNFLDQLAAGHSWMAGKSATLVISGDDLRPWRNRARQFALIRDGRFLVSSGDAGTALQADPLWLELAGNPRQKGGD